MKEKLEKLWRYFITKEKLTYICHKISEDTGISFNSVMLCYFLESILKKLATSKYKGKFIFKGGFLLSNVVGINTRTTTDIDFLLYNLELSKRNVIQILSEVFEPQKSDVVFYELRSIEPIKKEDEYGGFRVSVLCKMENIKQIIPLDIATGDIITPHSIDYKYVSSFDSDEIRIKAYPLETMLAEKIHTIYDKGFLNSRSKDYYDLYIIYKLKQKEVNWKTLKDACIRTFKYRKTEFNIKKIIDLLEDLRDDDSFSERWKSYSIKNTFVKETTFEEIIDNNIELIKKILNT